MAGGATFSESRACYEVSNSLNRDIFLATSHMQTPQLFTRQVGDLSVDKRRLDLPMERPPPRAPAHLFERPAPPPQPVNSAPNQRPGVGVPGRKPPPTGGMQGIPPTQAMSSMSLNPASSNNSGGGRPLSGDYGNSGGKSGERKEKSKRNFLGIKKH